MGHAAATTRRSAAAAPEPVTNLNDLPVILKLRDMSAVYRISQMTIRRNLAIGEFRPLPFQNYPFRWRRSDVIQHLNSPSGKLRYRKHGFAATKARRQAAEDQADADE